MFCRYAQSVYSDVPTATVQFTWKKQQEKVSKAKCGQQDLTAQHELLAYSEHFTKAKAERDASKDSLMYVDVLVTVCYSYAMSGRV